jgi:protein transport protein HofQ
MKRNWLLMWVTHVNRENGRGNEKERIKMNLRIMLWLLAFSHPLWAAAPKPVTLVVDDVPVVQVLQALVAQENRNLVISPDVSGTLSLNLTRVPWRQALQTVVTSAGLVLREEGGIFYVHTAAWQREQRERSEQERRVDSLMRRWSLKASFSYADAGELQKAAEKLLSPKGSLSLDKRTNRLLIRDNQTVVERCSAGPLRWIFPSSRSSWRRIL